MAELDVVLQDQINIAGMQENISRNLELPEKIELSGRSGIKTERSRSFKPVE